ncbi:carboxypeptidase-like regulatory domain-containing protein [Motilibacter deserti]|uniref:Carboxypeptidase regulatory-like domain-containing protein n=1 Tax=Motilibacter deserti TaxID=2714956 RepID=A0ABX0GZ56_9ACTN|nr:carboxypeptidase-like regulatory domain-containing protein [Motilibacter deserti]NHC16258.1 carboxypeptidase regulatory-like domain-containing protein [Motilibacter deserti]
MVDAHHQSTVAQQVARREVLRRAGLVGAAGAAAWAAPALTSTTAAYAVGSPPPGTDPDPNPTTGTLTGRIVDALTLAPLADATLRPSPGSNTVLATTDADGRFTLAGLAPGPRSFYVVRGLTGPASTHVQQLLDVTIVAGRQTVQNAYLVPFAPGVQRYTTVVAWQQGDLQFVLDAPTRAGGRAAVELTAGAALEDYVRVLRRGQGVDGDNVLVLQIDYGTTIPSSAFLLYANQVGGTPVPSTGAVARTYDNLAFGQIARAEVAAGPSGSPVWNIYRIDRSTAAPYALVNTLQPAPPVPPASNRYLVFAGTVPAATFTTPPITINVPAGTTSGALSSDAGGTQPYDVRGDYVDFVIDGVRRTGTWGHGTDVAPVPLTPGVHTFSLVIGAGGRGPFPNETIYLTAGRQLL